MTFTWHHRTSETTREGPHFSGDHAAGDALMHAVRAHTGERQEWPLAVITWQREMKDRGWSLKEVRE